ncbi:unnamed protein product [Rotaria sp. Silwood2]|nr:unnamed protein product [Rotaria sp. Silwood2]
MKNVLILEKIREICNTAKIIALLSAGHSDSFVEIAKQYCLHVCLGIDVFGKTVGIDGIEICAINIFLGFGCKVLAYDMKPHETTAKEQGFQYVTMHELYFDKVISIKMKQGAMSINTNRGGLVDTIALVEYLKSGKIREAVFDAYEHEDKYFYLDFSERVMNDDTLARFISISNTIVTSHQAFHTEEGLKTIAGSIVQSFLDSFLMNQKMIQ